MEISDQAVLVGLAVFLLAIHVAGSVLVLRTLQSASHHLERLGKLSELEDVLLRRGTRRGSKPADDPDAPKFSGANWGFGASALRNLLKEQE
jgi:hypothetical protein